MHCAKASIVQLIRENAVDHEVYGSNLLTSIVLKYIYATAWHTKVIGVSTNYLNILRRFK